MIFVIFKFIFFPVRFLCVKRSVYDLEDMSLLLLKIITRKKIRDKETTRIFLRLAVMHPVCYVQKFFFSILTKKQDNHIQIFYTILLCLAFCICSKLLNNMSKKISCEGQ